MGNKKPASTLIDCFLQLLIKIRVYLAYQHHTGSTYNQKMSFFLISIWHKLKLVQINHPRNSNAMTAVKGEVLESLGVVFHHSTSSKPMEIPEKQVGLPPAAVYFCNYLFSQTHKMMRIFTNMVLESRQRPLNSLL